MARGGARPGAGRPTGSLGKKTIARLQIAETAAAEGITPLEVMLKTMRALWEAEDYEAATKIAVDAAPYLHPRLSAVEQNTTLKGDTLSQLLRAIDGQTTGIANGGEPIGKPHLAS